RARPLHFEPLGAEEVGSLLAETSGVPGIRLSPRGGVRLACDGVEKVLLVTGELGSGRRRLDRIQMLAGVLFERNPETDDLVPDYCFMPDPADRGHFHIFSVRGSGRVARSGTGSFAAGVMRFEVGATLTPLEAPLKVVGRYVMASAEFDLEMAVAEPGLSPR